MLRVLTFAVLGVALVFSSPAALADGFVPLPSIEAQASTKAYFQTSLKIRFVKFVRGKAIVELRNDGAFKTTFKAQGLFFVPEVNPERAPQRMVAAGPFYVASRSTPLSSLGIAAGKKARVTLNVFCLDAHRSYPSDGQRYRIAKARLPKDLRSAISRGAATIVNSASARQASYRLQSHIWTVRSGDWVRLEGERKSERHDKKAPNQARDLLQLKSFRLAPSAK